VISKNNPCGFIRTLLRCGAFIALLVGIVHLGGCGGSSDSATSKGSVGSPAPEDPCLAGLPVPTPIPPSHRVVQLVNCSDQTLLGAANAAFKSGQSPTAVLPREQTWVMEPTGSPNNSNVLTIDIPPEWEDTKCAPGVACMAGGPRLWARTGCRYDIASDRAQCETGGCSGIYDCSAAHQSAAIGTTISEWTFYEPVQNGAGNIKYFKDSPDISSVDGVNLDMDIEPIGGDPADPFDAGGGHDIQWLAENYPLTVHGDDMRAANRCIEGFRLLRSDLTTGNPYGFVIEGDDGTPLGGDATVACFSNCARYAFPTPPAVGCDDSDHTSACYLWKTFCLGDPSLYGKKCTTDADCPVGGACWNEHDTSSKVNLTCQGRAFIKNKTCPTDVCTFPYGYVDPKDGQKFYSTQPPFGQCSDATTDPSLCIGDDTLHQVMRKSYTWPNDPQTYGGDAPLYRVIFSPGGNPVPITAAGPIPVCSSLPAIYGYASQYGGPGSGDKPCDISVNQNGAVFAVAHPNADAQHPWGCDLPPGGAGNEGVICRWQAAAN
jgi:hypothetical protein